MERFCVITNLQKDKDYELASTISEYLTSQGRFCQVLTSKGVDEDKRLRYVNLSELPDSLDCAIVLGGDGTLIQSANELVHRNIPILGINLGTLGFLTEVEKQSILPTLDDLMEGRYSIERRMMLCVQSEEDTYIGHALNDIVIGKEDYGTIITIEVRVGDELLDRYICDGVVIATPTGSTAYNLSAGGPVLSPGMEAIIITPVCPHSLNQRSIVVSAEEKLTILIGQSKCERVDQAVVSEDGRSVLHLQSGMRVQVARAQEYTSIVKMKGAGFYERMRSKLNGGRG